MIKNPYNPKTQIYTPLRMMGMSVNSFLTDNKKSFEGELGENESDFEKYQLGGVFFYMQRLPKIIFEYNVPIEMGDEEVTQKLFQAVMGWNDSYNKSSSQNPVESVTWYDCVSFCNKLSNLLGLEECYTMLDVEMNSVHITEATVKWDENKKGFRLPTEKEWELFARAGTKNKWSGTNEEIDLKDYAWYEVNSYEVNSGYTTHPVGEKLPNGWGLYDMSGNVWEWCWDLYNPKQDTLTRVLRGGSYWYHADFCRVAFRSGNVAGNRGGDRGFRLLRSFG